MTDDPSIQDLGHQAIMMESRKIISLLTSRDVEAVTCPKIGN